jgi:hypothetical protein
MQINYIDPLTRAWARMKSRLFAPFSARTWFVVGFTAWLATIFENGGSSAGSNWDSENRDPVEWGSGAAEFLANLGLGLLVIFVITALIALAILLLWLSSRMKFVFLDNVVRNEARVKGPWAEFASRGDSLFVWRFIFGLVAMLVGGAFVGAAIVSTGIAHGVGVEEASGIAIALFALALLGFVVIPAVYIGVFLESFIVPIMYRFDLSATAAWKRFLPLLRDHLFHFLLYGIFLVLLNIVVATFIILIGVFTCCVGFLLVALPYLGTVVTLPVWVTFRAFSLEYLAQFDPELNLFPDEGGTAVAGAPPPPPASPPPAEPPQPPRQIE